MPLFQFKAGVTVYADDAEEARAEVEELADAVSKGESTLWIEADEPEKVED